MLDEKATNDSKYGSKVGGAIKSMENEKDIKV